MMSQREGLVGLRVATFSFLLPIIASYFWCTVSTITIVVSNDHYCDVAKLILSYTYVVALRTVRWDVCRESFQDALWKLGMCPSSHVSDCCKQMLHQGHNSSRCIIEYLFSFPRCLAAWLLTTPYVLQNQQGSEVMSMLAHRSCFLVYPLYTVSKLYGGNTGYG